MVTRVLVLIVASLAAFVLGDDRRITLVRVTAVPPYPASHPATKPRWPLSVMTGDHVRPRASVAIGPVTMSRWPSLMPATLVETPDGPLRRAASALARPRMAATRMPRVDAVAFVTSER